MCNYLEILFNITLIYMCLEYESYISFHPPYSNDNIVETETFLWATYADLIPNQCVRNGLETACVCSMGMIV